MQILGLYYRATFAVAKSLGFSGLIRKTAPCTRLVWQDKGTRDPDQKDIMSPN